MKDYENFILDILKMVAEENDRCTDKKVPEDIPFADKDICPYDGDCSECPYETQCVEDIMTCMEDCDLSGVFSDGDSESWRLPDIESVIFNDPATIVFWGDGTKTVVKCMDGEKFERYAGFAAACMKKLFGSTSRAKAVMDYFAIEQIPSGKKQKKMHEQISMFDTYNSMADTIKEAINEALEK